MVKYNSNKNSEFADRGIIKTNIEKYLGMTDIKFNTDQVNQLTDLVMLLFKWNKSLNLTSIKDPLEMVTLHIIDSAVIVNLLKEDRVADVGTGAGFPGLVLAVLRPDIEFTLIDSIAKKLSFVRTAMVSLGLKNVKIINNRCENIIIDNKFKCIVSRAVASIGNLVEWSHSILADDGRLIAMKANVDENEKKSLPASAKIENIVELNVPGLEASRCAVIIKQV
ncbi:MAG: 16S rRNA (guanine(527)-N(7))-methyltransferase RsmG [Succinivibrio sp.]|nr:16S rRNA (guanine(527)-N(7))-methyltransferase RsmG [Succinivibrio sp.]